MGVIGVFLIYLKHRPTTPIKMAPRPEPAE
jgi:hypothetical protein